MCRQADIGLWLFPPVDTSGVLSAFYRLSPFRNGVRHRMPLCVKGAGKNLLIFDWGIVYI